MRRLSHAAVVVLIAGGLSGCFSSSEPLGDQGGQESGKTGNVAKSTDGTTVEIPDNGAEVVDGKWKGYPDLPYVPIEEEVAGIEIPRVYPETGDYVAGGEVPADVGNPAAKGEGEPVTGGSITVRFNATPGSLNPITDGSAYSTYIMSNVLDPLAWQDPETFEFEPYMAKKWVAEDSIILRPDYAGHERQIKLEGGQPGNSIRFEIVSNSEEDGEPKPVKLIVVDKAGKPVSNSWVGIASVEEGSTPTNMWTDENGMLETVADGIGSYTARVGDEIYGKLEGAGDGYVLKPAAEKSEQKPLELKTSDVINIERETVFTFYLRDDITWSDGEPFTAKDLLFAHAVVTNPTVDGDSLRVYYSNIVEIEALGEHTVRMKYREQYFDAFVVTASLSAITPPWHLFENLVEEQGYTLTLDRLTEEDERKQDAWSAHGAAFAKFFNESGDYSNEPLGTGPYRVGEWSEQDKRVVLERRKDYWNDEKAGFLDRIIYKFIDDNNTALKAIETGAIDFMTSVTAEQFFEELEPVPSWIQQEYVKATWYSPGYSWIGWNLRRPFFKDNRVRLALAMLFDKQTFFEKKIYGSGVLVSGTQYYFGPAYDRSVGSVGYDPSAARDLLADAGWIDTNGNGVLDKSGQEFRFTATLPRGSSTAADMFAIMQQSYRNVGIVMDIREMEWGTFDEALRDHDFDVVTLSWSGALESDFFQIWHSSQGAGDSRGSNFVGFDNGQADKLIEQFRVTLDEEERKRLAYDFHRIIDREQPYMFLWTSKSRGVYHQKYRGVKFYALRPGYDLREWWIPKKLQ